MQRNRAKSFGCRSGSLTGLSLLPSKVDRLCPLSAGGPRANMSRKTGESLWRKYRYTVNSVPSTRNVTLPSGKEKTGCASCLESSSNLTTEVSVVLWRDRRRELRECFDSEEVSLADVGSIVQLRRRVRTRWLRRHCVRRMIPLASLVMPRGNHLALILHGGTRPEASDPGQCADYIILLAFSREVLKALYKRT